MCNGAEFIQRGILITMQIDSTKGNAIIYVWRASDDCWLETTNKQNSVGLRQKSAIYTCICIHETNVSSVQYVDTTCVIFDSTYVFVHVSNYDILNVGICK